MRYRTLQIENYRAIKSLSLEQLSDTIIIAGPNGCGKSCVFDAIRLLKSIYGGYQPNEWQSFFGEFQIRLGQRPEEILEIFQDKTKMLRMAAEIELSTEELEYIKENGREMLKDQIWKELVPDLASWRFVGVQPMATQLRVHEPEVDQKAEEAWPAVLAELEQDTHWAHLEIDTAGNTGTAQSRILELVFSTYNPKKIGIVDFHGSTRNYQREQVGGINLNIESAEDQMRQHSLYNYANKYANLKTQMASGYVRNLLAGEVGGETAVADDLTETLKELFQTFFPGKEFLGPCPTPDGGLSFPVKTPSGGTHDIDELSSGEKEVLYGYLRLRNSAPQNSVVLIDEPELHLNPRLIQGLAGFYHEHIGKVLNNQIWLVSHSDTLIRDAVGHDAFSIFHMQPPEHIESGNQVSEVKVVEDVEKIVVELVGDLAAYRPEAKIVIFEGGGESAFDVEMVSRLFPEFAARVNAISGGNKRRVRDLYEVLEKTRIEASVPARFFSVVDKDDERFGTKLEAGLFAWDAYHIENYLLEPKYIVRVFDELLGKANRLTDESSAEDALVAGAEETIQGLVIRRMHTYANGKLVNSLSLGVHRDSECIPEAFSMAISNAQERMSRIVSEELTRTTLTEFERDVRQEATNSLADGTWRKKLRGRDILKRLARSYGGGTAYDQVRNLILARMRDDQFQPPGMKKILDQILDA